MCTLMAWIPVHAAGGSYVSAAEVCSAQVMHPYHAVDLLQNLGTMGGTPASPCCHACPREGTHSACLRPAVQVCGKESRIRMHWSLGGPPPDQGCSYLTTTAEGSSTQVRLFGTTARTVWGHQGVS